MKDEKKTKKSDSNIEQNKQEVDFEKEIQRLGDKIIKPKKRASIIKKGFIRCNIDHWSCCNNGSDWFIKD